MKKKLTLLTILNFFAISLFAQTSILVGDNSDFNGFTFDNLNVIYAERGKQNLELSHNEYIPAPDTDFLAHFNSDFKDSVGNYTVIESYNNISDVEKKLGDSSVFFFKDQGVVFSSSEESMFSPGRVLGDFTIEFWVYPTAISQDTTIFSWKGVNKVESDFIPQKIKCYFEDRKTVWEFENFFIPIDFSSYTVKLTGESKLLPNRWNHHLIRYNSEIGMLEYLMNGIPEDVKFTTNSQQEGGEIYPPFIGNFSKKDIYLGESLRGFIDEFRISESFITEPKLSKFKQFGSFKTPVYDLTGENVIFDNIEFIDTIKKETTISYKYRVSDKPFLTDNEFIPWLTSGKVPEQNFRYIQIYADFYSNGSSNVSPLLEGIKIDWFDIRKPPSPIKLETITSEKQIILKWQPIKHYGVDGYCIYYGTESNNYKEMIDVGKNTSYTIENLKSKNIYYFSVRSYYENKKSDYSLEVFNRPE